MLGKNLFCESGEEPQQSAWRSSGCLIPGSAQHDVGLGSEQPDLQEVIPVHSRMIETRKSLRFFPTLPTQSIVIP